MFWFSLSILGEAGLVYLAIRAIKQGRFLYWHLFIYLQIVWLILFLIILSNLK